MAATAQATEPKTRKPPKLFSVTGDSSGIKTVLSNYSKERITDAALVFAALSKAGDTFPKADGLVMAIADFMSDPTAPKDE